MSDDKDINLNEDYKKIVEGVEPPEQPKQELGKVDMNKFKPEEAQTADFHLGYHNIPVTELPSGGMFYPKNTQISIRSAKVAEIRHFSTVDESNVLDVDDKLNSIVESCTRVTSDKKRVSYKDLCEEDRFYLILSIRDLTFPEPESQLTVEHKDKKGKKHTVEIKKDYFQYFNIPDTLDKYYDEGKRTFLIETKSFGTIEMRPPSIGVMQKMTEYIKDRQEKGENIDQSVLQVMPYLVHEWRGFTDKDIFKFEIEMNNWSNKKYSLIYKLAEQMKVGIQPEMSVQIGDVEEVVPISFRDGIKSLFIVQDIAGELL
mgnify:FL=1